MVGVLVAKQIHVIGTRAEHDVPCITFKIPIEVVQRSPLASILDVSQLRIISIVGLLPLRVPAHYLCFLAFYKIPLETGTDRYIPYHFLGTFLPGLLVSRSIAHWTAGFFRVLPQINDAIVDACVVPNVRHIKRANDFLGLLDTRRTQVLRGKNFIM